MDANGAKMVAGVSQIVATKDARTVVTVNQIVGTKDVKMVAGASQIVVTNPVNDVKLNVLIASIDGNVTIYIVDNIYKYYRFL